MRTSRQKVLLALLGVFALGAFVFASESGNADPRNSVGAVVIPRMLSTGDPWPLYGALAKLWRDDTERLKEAPLPPLILPRDLPALPARSELRALGRTDAPLRVEQPARAEGSASRLGPRVSPPPPPEPIGNLPREAR